MEVLIDDYNIQMRYTLWMLAQYSKVPEDSLH